MNTLDTNTTDQIAVTSENTYWVEMYEALARLHKNEDFKKVILDGYFKDKAINGVSMLATPHVVENGLRSQVMEDLIAVSRLQDFFITIENLGTVPEEDEDSNEEG